MLNSAFFRIDSTLVRAQKSYQHYIYFTIFYSKKQTTAASFIKLRLEKNFYFLLKPESKDTWCLRFLAKNRRHQVSPGMVFLISQLLNLKTKTTRQLSANNKIGKIF